MQNTGSARKRALRASLSASTLWWESSQTEAAEIEVGFGQLILYTALTILRPLSLRQAVSTTSSKNQRAHLFRPTMPWYTPLFTFLGMLAALRLRFFSKWWGKISQSLHNLSPRRHSLMACSQSVVGPRKPAAQECKILKQTTAPTATSTNNSTAEWTINAFPVLHVAQRKRFHYKHRQSPFVIFVALVCAFFGRLTGHKTPPAKLSPGLAHHRWMPPAVQAWWMKTTETWWSIGFFFKGQCFQTWALVRRDGVGTQWRSCWDLLSYSRRWPWEQAKAATTTNMSNGTDWSY